MKRRSDKMVYKFIQEGILEYDISCDDEEDVKLLMELLRGRKPRHLWAEVWNGQIVLRVEIGPVEPKKI